MFFKNLFKKKSDKKAPVAKTMTIQSSKSAGNLSYPAPTGPINYSYGQPVMNYGSYPQPSGYPQANGYPQMQGPIVAPTYVSAGYRPPETNVLNVYQSKPYREEHYKKRIENPMIKRTEIVGSPEHGLKEFDDYFEKHVEKFFTPEIEQILLYHYQGYVFGLQFIYRDSWGKAHKETYNGDLHMANNIDKRNCECAKMTLGFDEHIREVYVECDDHITYLKFVTNQKNVLELGHKKSQQPKNIIPEMGKVLGIGGTTSACLNSIYFYYT